MQERREDVDTLGGLIFTLLDRVPARGEIVRHPAGIEFEVLDADPRRIKRVRILRQEPAGDRGRGLSLSAATRRDRGRPLAEPVPRAARALAALVARRACGPDPAAVSPLPAAARRSPGCSICCGTPSAAAAAFVLGWCFGFAHFLVGLYWIGIAFFTDAERFGVFAVPAVLLLCAYLACYPALAALADGAPSLAQPDRRRRWSWRSPGRPARWCAARCSAASPGT